MMRLPVTPGRYAMRNGAKVRVTAVDNIKTSDGETIPQAWGEEIVGGQMRMWNGNTGRRVPTDMPGARKQDLVKRLGR